MFFPGLRRSPASLSMRTIDVAVHLRSHRTMTAKTSHAEDDNSTYRRLQARVRRLYFGTDVIANKLYYELFAANNLGHASAIAVILLFTALPIAFINIFQFRSEARS